MEKIYKALVKNIRSYFKKAGFKKAVIGLSGGIDSSLSAFLVAKAIGPENLFGLILPEKGVSSRAGVEHGIEIAKIAGVKYKIIPINDFLKPFRKVGWRENKSAVINTKARIRANILYNYANTHDALVVGTSNKTELMLGYFTKYGDGAVDVEVIAGLYKTEVFELARYLGLPDEIINKEPSAELYHGHTDEKELGMVYEEIDKVLEGKKRSAKIMERVKNNKHKTDAIPKIKIK